MGQIFQTLKDIRSFLLFFSMILTSFTLLGMELFGYKVRFNSKDEYDPVGEVFPATTYNTFIEGFYGCFVLLGNDGWSTIYINHYRASLGFTATPFFLTLLIGCQYIMLNIFLAILL